MGEAACLVYGIPAAAPEKENVTGKDKGSGMEKEKVIKYLKGYYFAAREVRQIQQEINANAYEFGLKSPTVTGMPAGSAAGCNDLSKFAIKAESLMEKLERRKERQIEIMREISGTIGEIDDAEERLVLRYRYLILDRGHMATWERIAENCNLSRRSVIRTHERALGHIKIKRTF